MVKPWTYRPRVAMFVLNTCATDVRVRKEAASLAEIGCDVRVFAIRDNEFPAGIVREQYFTLHRLDASSLLQRTLWRVKHIRLQMTWAKDGALSRIRARTIGTRAAGQDLVRKAMGGAADSVETQPPLPNQISEPRLLEGLEQRLGRDRPIVFVNDEGDEGLFSRTLSRLGLLKSAVNLSIYGLVRGSLMPLHRTLVTWRFAKASTTAAEAWEPDVCHAHDLNVLPSAVRVARRSGAKVVYDSHELWRKRNRHGEKRPIARMVEAVVERRLIKRADLIITVSAGIRSWLRREYNLAVPVEIVRNVALELGSYSGPTVRDLTSLRNKRIAIYTGRIASGRGLESIVDALADLPEEVVLVLLGYGDHIFVKKLQYRSHRRGVAHRIWQVGAVNPDQLLGIMSGADCALVTVEPICLSYYYALPNKLFEAVQAGLPVVASDLPEIRHVVESYEIGKVFDVGNRSELRKQWMEVLVNRDNYKSNVRVAGTELKWELEARVLQRAYGKMINEGAPIRREGTDTSRL